MEHKNASSSERKRKKDSKSSSKESSGSKKSESSRDRDDKHGTVRSRNYAYISPESVTKIAESIGIPSLSDDIAVNLAEDVSYKLQEIIHTSCSFMRCCKRRKLLTSDVKSALQTCDAPPVYGHDGDDNTKFVFVPEAEVYVAEDTEVDLISVALGSETYVQNKPPNISTSWSILTNPQKTDSQSTNEKSTENSGFAVPHPKPSVNGDGTSMLKQELNSGKTPSNSRTLGLAPSSKPQNELSQNCERAFSGELSKSSKKVQSIGSSNFYQQQNSPKTNGNVTSSAELQNSSVLSSKSDLKTSSRIYDPSADPNISATQLSYFNIASDCILRGSDSHFEAVLTDLRTNNKLGLVVPYFLNLVAFTIYRVPRNFTLIQRLLSTVDVLLTNQSVNPSYSLAVNRVVNALLAVTSDHRMLDNVDDFKLRRSAAQLLARVFAEWNVEDEHVLELLSQLRLVLDDCTEPVQSHYGALVIFEALGYPVLSDYLGPILRNYLPRLQEMIEQCPPNDRRLAQHLQDIRGVILSAAEVLYCSYREDVPSKSDSRKAMMELELDRLLYEHFGDSLCARRRHFPLRDRVFRESRTFEAEITPSDVTRTTDPTPSSSWRLFVAKARLHKLKTSLPVPNIKRRTHHSDVFEGRLCNSIGRRKYINFTFAGANPVPKERLRRRQLDHTHAQSAQHVRSPAHNLFQTQSYAIGKQRRGRNTNAYSLGNRLSLGDANSLLRQS